MAPSTYTAVPFQPPIPPPPPPHHTTPMANTPSTKLLNYIFLFFLFFPLGPLLPPLVRSTSLENQESCTEYSSTELICFSRLTAMYRALMTNWRSAENSPCSPAEACLQLSAPCFCRRRPSVESGGKHWSVTSVDVSLGFNQLTTESIQATHTKRLNQLMASRKFLSTDQLC